MTSVMPTWPRAATARSKMPFGTQRVLARHAGSENGVDLVDRQAGRLARLFVGVGRISRAPFSEDDVDGDLALTLAQRVAGTEVPSGLSPWRPSDCAPRSCS